MPEQAPAASVTTNTLANFAGRGWSVLMNFCFLPIYIRMLGPEAYGLVAFSATLNSLFSLLDLGLTTTINRELARMAADPHTRSQARTVVRTLESFYWPIGAVIAFVVLASSKLLSQHWLNAHALDPAIVRRAVQLIGLQLALLWPYSLYEGGLLGLERQVTVNVLAAAGATIRGLGALVALKFYAPTIIVFLGWQIIANGMLTLSVAVLLWRKLPPGTSAATVDVSVLKRIRSFTLGMTAISLVSLVLTQLDKIILSKMLSLEHFGYYMLAAGVAASITNCASPFFLSLLPRFVRLWSVRDDASLATLYHQSSQALSVVVIPVGCVVSLFATDLVRVWTGDAGIARQAGPLVSMLVIGYMFNSLMVLPYALQLAAGWTTLAFYQNLISILVLSPLLIVFTKLYQGFGAAVVWIMLNVGYLAICVPLTHRRILRREQRRWYLDDIGRPFLITAFTLVGAKWAAVHVTILPLRLLVALGGWLVAIAVCAWTIPAVGNLAARLLRYPLGALHAPRR